MSAVLFVLLSGAGWVFDMALFWAGVSLLGLPPGIANVISATVAAMTVYAVSRSLVFGTSARPDRSFIAYFAYVEINIVLFSAAIQLLAGLIAGRQFVADPDLAALVAKVIVTPFSLACNFLVARWLSRRA